MSCYINPRTYMQIHNPTVVQGGGGRGVDEIPLTVFDIWQYFETILPSVESLWSFLQNEVYFIGGGAAGNLWPTMVAILAAILDFTKN